MYAVSYCISVFCVIDVGVSGLGLLKSDTAGVDAFEGEMSEFCIPVFEIYGFGMLGAGKLSVVAGVVIPEVGALVLGSLGLEISELPLLLQLISNAHNAVKINSLLFFTMQPLPLKVFT